MKPRNIPQSGYNDPVTKDQVTYYINKLKMDGKSLFDFRTKILIPITMGDKTVVLRGEINRFFMPLQAIRIVNFNILCALLKANIEEAIFNELYDGWIEDISSSTRLRKEEVIKIIDHYTPKNETV